MKYPISIPFIISNEFCERFNYYGLRTILALYLSRKLYYDEASSIYLFHVFSTFVYLFPVLGAIIADSWLGKYKTISYLSLVYAIGGVLITLGAIPSLGLDVKSTTIIGLLLIAFGTGGIKPCTSAFGGDQFKLPEQAEQLVTFFSLFYCAINAGSLISTILTPILRQNVHCFGDQDCYSLAFGVPAILMIISILIFMAGKKSYVMQEPTGNLFKLLKCIGFAFSRKITGRSIGNHWLDSSERKFGYEMVSDLKAFFKILVLYIPLPIFWALYDQQGSRWIFQASRLNPRVFGYVIQPDQLQFLNPLLIIIFVPLFRCCVFPFMQKSSIGRPLQKLIIGGFLVTLAFLAAGIIGKQQSRLDKEFKQPGLNKSELILINGFPSNFSIELGNKSEIFLKKYDFLQMSVNESQKVSFKFHPNDKRFKPFSMSGNVTEDGFNTFLIRPYFYQINSYSIIIDEVNLTYSRPKHYNPEIAIILANASVVHNLTLISQNYSIEFDLHSGREYLDHELPRNGLFNVSINGKVVQTNLKFDYGEKSLLIIGVDKEMQLVLEKVVILKPYSISILSMIPQFVLMTAGEILFSVTGLEFSYSQAPKSMKSIIQACWLLTVAIGNLIVVIITKINLFSNPVDEIYFYCLLMFLDMIIFMIFAYNYKYKEEIDDDSLLVRSRGIPMKRMQNSNASPIVIAPDCYE